MYISESGEYLFKLSNCYDDVYIYTDASGSTYLNSSNNYQAVIYLYSGNNDITVKYSSPYKSGSFHLTVSKYEPFAENATKIVGTSSMGQDNTYSVSVGPSYVRWFELIAPQSGYYTFSLDSYDAYMVAYTNEDDNGNEHTSSFQVYLDEGDSYFIKIKGNTSYSTSVDFTVSGAGLTSDSAIEMSNNSYYDVYVAEGGYVWLKFYASSGYTYSVSVDSNYTNTNTYIYDGNGYTESNYSGYNYSTSAYSSYGEYFYVRINATTGGNVSVSLSRS